MGRRSEIPSQSGRILITPQPEQKENPMAEQEKKSLFDKAIDALTDRDEKEAAAKAAA